MDLCKTYSDFAKERAAIERLSSLRDDAIRLYRDLPSDISPFATNVRLTDSAVERYTGLLENLRNSIPLIGEPSFIRIEGDLRNTRHITGMMAPEAVRFTESLILRLESDIDARQESQNFRIAIGTALLAVFATVLAFISAVFDALAFFFK